MKRTILFICNNHEFCKYTLQEKTITFAWEPCVQKVTHPMLRGNLGTPKPLPENPTLGDILRSAVPTTEEVMAEFNRDEEGFSQMMFFNESNSIELG